MARYAVRLLRDLELSSRAAFCDSIALSFAILKVAPDSLLNVPRLKLLYRLARRLDLDGIEGDFVECGVYRGASAAILGYALRDSKYSRRLWLFDSFQGLPAPSPSDGADAPARKGDFVGEEQQVIRLLNRLGTPTDRVHIMAGWFSDTFPRTPTGRVALLHLDADWYESTKLSLDRFYETVEPHGFVVLDDYGDPEWPGCKRGVDDFVAERSLSLEIQTSDGSQGYFRKPG